MDITKVKTITLKNERIGKERAIELLRQRYVNHANATVELWLSGPLSERKRIAYNNFNAA